MSAARRRKEKKKPTHTVHHIVMAPLGTIEMLHCNLDYRGPAIVTSDWKKVTCGRCLMLKGQ